MKPVHELTPDQKLRSPDGRLWELVSINREQHLVSLERLDKRPREHQVVVKDLAVVNVYWERLP